MLSGCTQQLESISGSLTRLSNNLNQIAGTSSSSSKSGEINLTDKECEAFLSQYYAWGGNREEPSVLSGSGEEFLTYRYCRDKGAVEAMDKVMENLDKL